MDNEYVKQGWVFGWVFGSMVNRTGAETKNPALRRM